MYSEIEVPLSPGGNSVYFWERLSSIGDVLILSGRYLQPLNARISINRYAKKRGWHIKIDKLDGGKIRFVRTA